MEKKLQQIVSQVKALKIIPKNIDICGRLIQQYIQSCSFETMPRLAWLEWYETLDDLLAIYWKIRGR